jgi:hypothetical protein
VQSETKSVSQTFLLLLILSACNAPIRSPDLTVTLAPATTPTAAPTPASATEAIELETYGVYTALFSEYMDDEKSVVYLVNETITPDDVLKSVNYIRSKMKWVDPATLTNFESVYGTSVSLNSMFGPGVNIVLLTSDEVRAIFENADDGWEAFYQLYPQAVGIFNVSQVGFNPKMTQALIRRDVEWHRRGCFSDYVLLERNSDKWEAISTIAYSRC